MRLLSVDDEYGYAALSQDYIRLPKPYCLLGKGGFSVVLRHVSAIWMLLAPRIIMFPLPPQCLIFIINIPYLCIVQQKDRGGFGNKTREHELLEVRRDSVRST